MLESSLLCYFYGPWALSVRPPPHHRYLLVVTPSDEMPLTCENGACSTELAAICLQPDRSNPQRSKSYSVNVSDAGIAMPEAYG